MSTISKLPLLSKELGEGEVWQSSPVFKGAFFHLQPIPWPQDKFLLLGCGGQELKQRHLKFEQGCLHMQKLYCAHVPHLCQKMKVKKMSRHHLGSVSFFAFI